MNTNDIPDILTVNDLQEALKVGRSTAYNLVQNHEIKTFRVGKLIRIRREDFIDYMSKKCDNYSQ